MKIELKCDKEGKFGFVEKFKPYIYGDLSTLSVRVMVDVGNKISEPYVFRGGLFIPAEQIEKEMGISKYIKAKKPFYSVLGTGNLIADLKVAYHTKSKEFIKDKSDVKLYGIVRDSLVYKEKEGWSVDIRKLTSSSPELDSWFEQTLMTIIDVNRENFLKLRFEK